jgi:hypothetical protein
MCHASVTKVELLPRALRASWKDDARAAAIVVAVSGFHGFVEKGPTTPVCRAGQPCTAPAQVTLVFRNMRTTRTFRTRSNTQGAYRILLTPGYYTVTTVERIGLARNIRPRPSTSAPPTSTGSTSRSTRASASPYPTKMPSTHAIALFVPAR